MKRFAILGVLLAALVSSACDKPTPESCEKALRNMQALLGTDNLNTTASLQGEIRRCRGGSSKAAVDCAIKATSLTELEACDFERLGPHHGSGLDSVTGSAGSAK
jgi:hypothetical protein